MAGKARYSDCDLADLMPLFVPWTDRNGLLRPAFSSEAALLSYELACTAYDLRPEAWRAAGWRDISYQVDNKLLTGPGVNKTGERSVSGVLSGYYQHLARARLKRSNPISQLRGALRQRESSDTCKAVVMLHPLPAGRYLVAIGFMGTGKRIYDWFSNFRLNREEGMHAGFLQVTKEFEKNADAISFPETARELGLNRLTLGDILEECRRPDSRFRLWMAGHSQGGAVMQLFAFREIQKGFLRQHMLGYGFASPSVVYEHPKCDLGAVPLFHIFNADDVFPRVGARLHIGSCRVMYPDAAMRKACCKTAWADPVYRAVAVLMRQVSDTGRAFLLVHAMLLALEDIDADDAMTALNGLAGSLLPEKVTDMLTSRKENILQYLMGKTALGYDVAANGQEMPKEEVLILRRRIAALIREYGAVPFYRAAMLTVSLSHKLRASIQENGVAPYQYIVTERCGALRSRIWCAPASRMAPPERRKTGRRHGGRFARLSAERNRC